MTGRTLRAALGTTVSASAAPYGYTVTLWSSGAMLIHHQGVPHPGWVFAFAAGALAAFGLVGAVAHGALVDAPPLEDPRHRVLAGMLNWVAVGAAVGVVALLGGVHGWVAWPLGSFAATAVYLVVASLQLAVVTLRRG